MALIVLCVLIVSLETQCRPLAPVLNRQICAHGRLDDHASDARCCRRCGTAL